MFTWSVFAALTFMAGVAMGAIGAVVLYNHEGPGSTAFVVTMLGCFLLGTSYGLNLFTFDRQLSIYLEIPYWLGSELVVIGLFFFAVAFTGRNRYFTKQNAVLLSAIPLVTILVATTNALGYHTWFWSDYQIVEIFGAGVRTVEREPWVYVKTTYAGIIAGAAYLMLLEEIFTETVLYRNQSLALILGGVIPFSGFNLWLLELGPYPEIDFLGPFLWSAVILYGYVVFGTGLFETAPAVRRIGRQHTIDTVDDAIVILDDEGIITDFNAAATDLFGEKRSTMLSTHLEQFLGDVSINLYERSHSLSIETDSGWREFDVTVSKMDEQGEVIGYTVMFHDITEERRRKQRLQVLNRILRHNLRNDISAVRGFTETISRQTDDEQINEWAIRAMENCEDLVELGDKARRFEQAIEGDGPNRSSIQITDLINSVVTQFERSNPAATIQTSEDKEISISTDPELLELILSNLIENAIEHHDSDEPVIGISCQCDGEQVVIEISDDGPGIPETEIETLDEGKEQPLQHGQGIGLWLVNWCVTSLGGTVSFETNDHGTTVTVTLPGNGSENLTSEGEIRTIEGRSA